MSISPRDPLAFHTELTRTPEPALAWFAIATYPKHERKTADHLPFRGIEAFLPTYTVKRRWRNRQTVNLSLPLFPGYVFACFSSAQRAAVLSLPGVITVIGGGRSASAVPEHYIQTLRKAVALGRVVPYRDPVIGDRVRITSGPLQGVEGVLAHINSAFQVVVTIELIRQTASIVVSREEIEPVQHRPVRVVD